MHLPKRPGRVVRTAGQGAATSAVLPRAPTPVSPAEAALSGLWSVDPLRNPPDLGLIRQLGAGRCIRLGLLPWRQVGAATVVLADGAGQLRRHAALLAETYGPVRLAHAPLSVMQSAIIATAGADLAHEAESLVPAAQSCRAARPRLARRLAFGLIMAVALGAATAPAALFALLAIWAATSIGLNTLLKLAALWAALARPADAGPVAAAPVPARLPVVSILIPLYREKEIAAALVSRLALIDYPAELLDVCLILEEDDATTRAALASASLPPGFQVIEVPAGRIRTKPRALNIALNFARGSIIGIYDAEDAPAPDQIRKVVQRFAERGPDVACLQGVLDYYNTDSNWMSRCFTLEYAAWFRVMLPGLARLGLVLPLGGTTLFLRRPAIEAVCGWDAHNVTEDADLGVRLARAGYRTEMIDTVTMEEANARPWPWVKQRSRWIKGYALTWAVHMRDPAQLWRDLGPLRFFALQLQLLGAISQFTMAPLLWAFWWATLATPTTVAGLIGPGAMLAIFALCVVAEAVNLAMAVIGARRSGRFWLVLWAPVLKLYYPLATLAAWKALAETVTRPYYWDKTTHGVFRPSVTPPVRPAARPAAAV